MVSVPVSSRHADDAEAISEREFLERLGARVRSIREQARLTRRQLAAMARVSERYLGQLEAGEGNISIMLLRRVAASLGTPLSDFLSSEPEALAERLARRFLKHVPAGRMEEVLVRLAREFGPDGDSRRERIALVGLRGAGKSTLGERLAHELRLPFVELDREIEREAGLPLSELFSMYGPPGFRRLERRCLERVLNEYDRAVIAVGGGIVSDEETYELLLARCHTVWVKASPEEHMARVVAQGDLRPMAHSAEAMDELKQLLQSREALYQRADAVVDTSGLGIEAAFDRLRGSVERH